MIKEAITQNEDNVKLKMNKQFFNENLFTSTKDLYEMYLQYKNAGNSNMKDISDVVAIKKIIEERVKSKKGFAKIFNFNRFKEKRILEQANEDIESYKENIKKLNKSKSFTNIVKEAPITNDISEIFNK